MTRRSWVPAALAVVVAAVAAAYFAPLGDWVADNPLPGQEWMRQHTGVALGVFALVMLLTGALAWQRRDNPSGDSAPDATFDPLADGYLDDLRKRMKVIWIDEFLSRSLERIVPAKLGFQERRDAIIGPLRIFGTPSLTGIVEIFADERTARRLVVLGGPGAGKTTQLLRLAEHLLDDTDGPVPIVVSLSGSSWKVEAHKRTGMHLAWLRRSPAEDEEEESAEEVAIRKERLDAAKQAQLELAVDTAVGWLAWQIGRLYQLPPKRVRRWLRADRSPIVLLFDGLDEIRDAEDRGRCVEVLSLLRSQLNTGMVVCSRTEEYFASGRRLAFGAAVEIMPLQAVDIDGYLHEAGQELASLREACRRNPQLLRLLDTPLTLTVAVLAYRGKLVDEKLVRELIANRLDHLWSTYLTEALPRIRGLTSTTPFSHAQTLHYARGLARLMESAGRDSFSVDELNLSWLSRDAKPGPTKLYKVFALCCGAGVNGLAWITAGPTVGITSAGMLLAIWEVSRFHSVIPDSGAPGIDSAEFISVHWRLDWRAAGSALVRMTTFGLLLGLAFSKVGGALGWVGGFHGLLLGLLPGLAAGCAAAVMALPARTVGHTSPHGRQISAAGRTLIVRLIAGAVALIALAAAPLVSDAVAEPLRAPLLHITLAATTGAWIAGFAVSMTGWWSHRAALRLVMRDGVLPRELETFLTYTEDRIITRRKLDGHSFLHRTLQSHLAEYSTDGRTDRQAGDLSKF